MASHRKLASAGRSGKVAERLKRSIEKGEYYEAHQSLRALYQRYKTQGRDSDSFQLLREGATLLLKHRQWESGTDICCLLATHLKENKTPVSEELLDMVEELYRLFRVEGSAEHQAWTDGANREAFMRAAIKWTSLVDDKHKYGHPRLHRLVARTSWEEGVLDSARECFLYAQAPREFGDFLVQFSRARGAPGTADLFIAQPVLQLLVLNQRNIAFETFMAYCGKHSAFSTDMPPPFVSAPLLNFIWFLLLSMDIGSSELFLFLRKWYTPVINRDPQYHQYLDKIGEQFFGIKQAGKPGAAGGLLGLLSGGGGESNGVVGDLLSSLEGFLGGGLGTANNSMPSIAPTVALHATESAEGLD